MTFLNEGMRGVGAIHESPLLLILFSPSSITH